MNSNIKIFLLCPVSENQKPINELIELEENSFFQWVTFSKKKYEEQFVLFYFFTLFLVSLLFFFLQVPRFFLASIFLTTLFFFLFFFLLFFRWYQIEAKLNQSRFFYEEGSWYDGQIWEKPLLVIKNDRLLLSQKVYPIIQRIGRTLLSLFFVLVTFFFLLFQT